jgi:hypothetical protein
MQQAHLTLGKGKIIQPRLPRRLVEVARPHARLEVDRAVAAVDEEGSQCIWVCARRHTSPIVAFRKYRCETHRSCVPQIVRWPSRRVRRGPSTRRRPFLKILSPLVAVRVPQDLAVERLATAESVSGPGPDLVGAAGVSSQYSTRTSYKGLSGTSNSAGGSGRDTRFNRCEI